MNTVLEFLSQHWIVVTAAVMAGVIIPSALKLITLVRTHGLEWIHAKLEYLRTEINKNELAAQVQADDAIITILQEFIPEVIHELDDTVQKEIQAGRFTSLDWNKLGEALWAKGRAEIETGVQNYMEKSGEKDGKIIAALVARKFFTKQAALQKGLIKE